MARNNPDALRVDPSPCVVVAALLFGLGAEIAPVLQRELEAQHDIFHSASVPDFKNNTKYAVITDNLREVTTLWHLTLLGKRVRWGGRNKKGMGPENGQWNLAGFGELSWFKAGLDGTIGLPDINILQVFAPFFAAFHATFFSGFVQVWKRTVTFDETDEDRAMEGAAMEREHESTENFRSGDCDAIQDVRSRCETGPDVLEGVLRQLWHRKQPQVLNEGWMVGFQKWVRCIPERRREEEAGGDMPQVRCRSPYAYLVVSVVLASRIMIRRSCCTGVGHTRFGTARCTDVRCGATRGARQGGCG
eukprot:3619036-Rhodomonas_salina.1